MTGAALVKGRHCKEKTVTAGKEVVLNRAHFRKFAQILEAKASEVLTRVDARSAVSAEQKSRRTDQADLAAQNHEDWIADNREHLDHILLFQIKDALNRVEKGEFGECQGCGEVISLERLKAIPWTRHCIDCQDEAGEAA